MSSLFLSCCYNSKTSMINISYIH
eukprot:UN06191